MGQAALVICEELEGPALNLTKILNLFAVPWTRLGPETLGAPFSGGSCKPYCILAATTLVGRMMMNQPSGSLPLLHGAESIFLYGGDQSDATKTLLRRMGIDAQILPIEGKEAVCRVSDQSRPVCGALSGLEVRVPVRAAQQAIGPFAPGLPLDCFISSKEGCAFGATELQGVRCYLAPSLEVIDIDLPVEKGFFDVADYFLSAVPFVMYLCHAFAEAALNPVDRGACLIIDDPVLRRQYGFVNFQKLAADTARHDFSCNIALIPWNWSRSASSVVELFRTHRDRLSLSVHGCDHTVQEFAGNNIARLNAQAKLANARMEKHRSRTGLGHDALMVFPQGAFSPPSLGVLKHNGFIAAVNTEVAPIGQPDSTKIEDTWRMAIMKYSDFAIYTRRYPFHGLYNFAFDILLGKPCIVVTHHTDFQNDGGDLLEFIDRLNALKLSLKWRSLGDVIRRAYQQRSVNGVHQIRMFGNEILIENSSHLSRRIIVEKHERDANAIDRVECDGRRVEHISAGEFARFETEVKPGGSSVVHVYFRDVYGEAGYKQDLRRQLKIAARRYLSEIRDELQCRAPAIHKQVERTRKWVRSSRRRSSSG